MTHVEVEGTVDAPAEAVWDCFVGTRSEELVVGVFADRLEMEGSGDGAIRTTYLRDNGGVIRERLDFWDEENMICRYSLIEAGPMPYENYSGQISVTPTGPSGCVVKLQADFTPVGMSEKDSIAIYEQHNRAGIEKIKEMLKP